MSVWLLLFGAVMLGVTMTLIAVGVYALYANYRKGLRIGFESLMTRQLGITCRFDEKYQVTVFIAHNDLKDPCLKCEKAVLAGQEYMREGIGRRGRNRLYPVHYFCFTMLLPSDERLKIS